MKKQSKRNRILVAFGLWTSTTLAKTTTTTMTTTMTNAKPAPDNNGIITLPLLSHDALHKRRLREMGLEYTINSNSRSNSNSRQPYVPTNIRRTTRQPRQTTENENDPNISTLEFE
jgi:hypothetical protein